MAFIPETNRSLGIGLAITGTLLISINYLAEYFSDFWFPKLLLSGITLVIIGIVMIVFPPINISIGEPTKYLSDIFKKSKKIYVVIWIISLPVSITLAFWYVIKMGYPL